MALFTRSDLALMRIPFSVFLMPVFWLAWFMAGAPLSWQSISTFIVIHLLLYPASNGYNSYCDKDTTPIGGLENPPLPGAGLLRLVTIFDALVIGLAFAVNIPFAVMITLYTLASKAYSWPRIRIKKYPIFSTVWVVFFQGFFTYILSLSGLGKVDPMVLFSPTHLLAGVVASLFLAGSYPITQIYQHQADAEHGDTTLSMRLGIRGTLLWSAACFAVASSGLAFMAIQKVGFLYFLAFPIAMAPVGYFLMMWMIRVWQNEGAADFKATMRMNTLSSLCLSAVFIFYGVVLHLG